MDTVGTAVALETAALRVAWLVLGDRDAAAALVSAAITDGGAADLLERVRRRALVARAHGGRQVHHEELWTTTRHLGRRARAEVAQRLFAPVAPAA